MNWGKARGHRRSESQEQHQTELVIDTAAQSVHSIYSYTQPAADVTGVFSFLG